MIYTNLFDDLYEFQEKIDSLHFGAALFIPYI